MKIFTKTIYFTLAVFSFVLLIGCKKAVPLSISEKWIPSYKDDPKTLIYFGQTITPLEFGKSKLPANEKNEYWSPIEVPANITLSVFGEYKVSFGNLDYSGKNSIGLPALKPEKIYLIKAKYVVMPLGDLKTGLSFILYEYENKKEGQWIRQKLIESDKTIDNSAYH